MPRLFKSEVLSLVSQHDIARYEEIKQDVLVGGGKRFELISEEGHWEKETGNRIIHVQYIEDDGSQDDPERY